MSELSEEEIARLLFARSRMSPADPQTWEEADDGMQAWLLGHARAVLALLQPALERARVALTDEQDHLLMCAIENLRSAERNDRTVEAAWRMAEKMEAWRKAAAIRKG